MPRCRVVQPDVVKLPLSEGDWLEVKKQLNFGDHTRAAIKLYGRTLADGSREPDIETLGMSMEMAYIVAWSFRDADDKPIPVSFSALESFDRETVREIEAAVSTHAAAVTKEIADRKNDQSGSVASAATS
jgi:hypothetical protein